MPTLRACNHRGVRRRPTNLALRTGPFGHAWYMTLDRMATRLFVEGSAKFIGFKVALDTAIFGPLHVLGYFSYMELGMGGTWAQAKAKIAKDFWPTFGAEIVIWPPLQTINFMHVPPTHHLLVVNIITIIGAPPQRQRAGGWAPCGAATAARRTGTVAGACAPQLYSVPLVRPHSDPRTHALQIAPSCPGAARPTTGCTCCSLPSSAA